MKVLGIGNALVDIMTKLDGDHRLNELGLQKGSMQLVDFQLSNHIIDLTKDLPKELSSGGSAANTIHGLARCGVECSFIGKTGHDAYGRFFSDDMLASGIHPVLLKGEADTGRAVALISPDSERTFATCLGAAIELSPVDLTEEYFRGYDYLYIEGYLVQNTALIDKAVELASKASLRIVLDLASFNVVEQNLGYLRKTVEEHVDIVFANEEEAHAFTGYKPEIALDVLSGICNTVVVKIGSRGSLVKSFGETYNINPVKTNALDTTGAGDAYAAGFLYGMVRGKDPGICGHYGSLLASSAIEVIGAKIPAAKWPQLLEQLEMMV